MTSPENITPEQNEAVQEQDLPPVIPPAVFLVVSLAGFLAAVTVFFVAEEFNIIGWGGLGVGTIALLLWAFMFPEEVLKLIRGRGLSYGGFGIVVTAVLIVASMLVYTVIGDQGWSRDFSERDVYSLDSEVREVLNAMGDDPSIPEVYILGFYGATQGTQRDRIEVLLQDMVNNSGSKIAGYDFVDPVVENVRTQSYLGDNPQIPSIVVVATENGEPGFTRYEVAARDFSSPVVSGQFQIINAILSLSIEGDFRAYFLDVDGSLDIEDRGTKGASGIVDDIDDEWTVEQIPPILLENPPFTLNDPTASAEVMIIAGGTQALSDSEVAVINDYVQNGGDLIVLGDINTDGGVATALADNFSTMLWENFGVRLRNDIVIDPASPVRQLGRVFLVNNYGTDSIVSGLNPAENQLVMSSPHSVEIASNPPATISLLVSTSEQGYAKSDPDLSRDLTESDLAFAENDLSGEIPLVVLAENDASGANLFLAGSTDLMRNEWRAYADIEAPEVSESAIYRVSGAQNFSEVVRQLVPEPPEVDQPIFITGFQVRYMSFIAIGVIPFGILGLGILVWWVRRPSHTV